MNQTTAVVLIVISSLNLTATATLALILSKKGKKMEREMDAAKSKVGNALKDVRTALSNIEI